ncbi:elongation of fatty acids protein 3-like [Momordica charantia]|uniref:very-long-chain 3-oxoacyl-CoA synthase n=1 Tax=Momordica charantia TaxID=3673 RepID=A0A6J1DLU5_MOMCH|nr:elongation of fatty acids protein 3-like [Momordica charantia]
MNQIVSVLEPWLVNHPIILNFQWIEGRTLGSTPLFLTLTVCSYLSLSLLLRHVPLPSISPAFLAPISALHNLTLLLLSLLMAVGCSLSALRHAHSVVCLPPPTSRSGPLFFWAHLFYLSKILEFVDTLLIILSGSFRRLTFLHVYHHSTVPIMAYLWLHTAQSLFPVALVTNATVHVVMYGYYFLCSVGVRPTWKRLVTDCQILQFVFSFVASGWMLYEHFGGSAAGCSGIWGWCFNAVFNASLLALFLNFHFKSYAANANKRVESKSH